VVILLAACLEDGIVNIHDIGRVQFGGDTLQRLLASLAIGVVFDAIFVCGSPALYSEPLAEIGRITTDGYNSADHRGFAQLIAIERGACSSVG
jgi:hypothetical protein